MAIENRQFTHAYKGQLLPPRFHDDLQDPWSFGWEFMNSELGAAVESVVGASDSVSGECSCYGQFTCNNGVITVLDSSVDWRARMLDIEVVSVTAANELPQQANYDPNLGAGTWDYNLMWTGNGATPVAVPVGIRWNPPGLANQYLFAASAAGGGAVAGDLCWSNNGLAAVFVMVRAQRIGQLN